MDFNIQKLVCVYLHLCEYIFNKRKKPTLLRNLTRVFESGEKSGVQLKKFLLEHLR